jgi:hypothetical protein
MKKTIIIGWELNPNKAFKNVDPEVLLQLNPPASNRFLRNSLKVDQSQKVKIEDSNTKLISSNEEIKI